MLEDRACPALIHVTTPLDVHVDGQTTLREAIAAVGASDTIDFTGAAANADIHVSFPDNFLISNSAFTISSTVTIDGTALGTHAIVYDPQPIGIFGTFPFRIFRVNGGNLTLKNINISGGDAQGGNGGLILLQAGQVNLTNTILSGGNAANGGAISVEGGTLNLTNSTIKSNHATNGGGMYQNNGTVNFNGGVTLDSNTASTDGGGYDVDGGLIGGFANFTNNTATRNGGGFRIGVGGGTLNLGGFTLTGNKASNGGLAVLENVNMTVNGAVASSNSAANGGAFAISKSTVILDGANLSSNTATGTGGGGAIVLDNSTLTVRNGSVLRDNHANSGRGGAIGFLNGLPNTTSAVTIDNSTIDANSASDGGGIAVIGGTLTLQNSAIVSSNSAIGVGGGVEILDGQVTVRTATVIKKNQAAFGGGIGISSNTAILTVDASTIGGSVDTDANAASLDGGGIYQAGGADDTHVQSGSVVQNNKAGRDGGGIWANSGFVTVTNSTLKNNSAVGFGGAMAAFNSVGVTIIESILGGLAAADANKAANGGAFAVSGSATKFNFDRSTAANNSATQFGAAVWANDGLTWITNSTISTNSGNSGVYIAGGTVRFTNATVASNSNIGVTRTAGTADIANSLFANNTNSDITGAVFSRGFNLLGTTTGITSGTVASDVTNSQYVELQPLANNGGPTPTHAITSSSDAANGGSNALAIDPGFANNALTIDQRGSARVFGNVVDIGAFELVDNTPATPTVTPLPAGTVATNAPIFFQLKFTKSVRFFTTANIGVANGNIVANTFNQIDRRTFIVQVAPLIDGTVTVSTIALTAVDFVGNPIQIGTGSVIYDTKKPTAAITVAPPGFSGALNTSFEFTGTDPLFNGVNSGIDHFEYQVDTSVFATATSPLPLNNIPEGAHSFKVRAIDKAGNVGDPVQFNWVIDITPPTVAITSMPAPLSNNRLGLFNFMGADPAGNGIQSGINHYEVQIDGAGFRSAVSPFTSASLTDGEHLFEVRAVDNAGNIGNPANFKWNIDATPPTITFTDKPNQFSNVKAPLFGFTAADPIVNGFASGFDHFETSLDSTAFVAATSPVTLAILADGTHKFQARAVDKAGNIGLAEYVWVIDTVPPTVTVSNPSVTTTINGPVTFTVVYSDANMGPITLSPADITLNKTGTASATVAVTGSGLTRTVTLTDTIGNGTLGITIGAGSATDLAGNLALASAASVTFTVDGTRTLTISQPAAPAYFLPGSTYVDFIDYTSSGTQNSVNAYIQISLPTMATFDVNNSTAGWTDLGGGKYQFNLGTLLAPGMSGRIAFAVTFSADTPPTATGIFTAIISDALGGGAAVASSTISAGIFDPLRPRWQRG